MTGPSPRPPLLADPALRWLAILLTIAVAAPLWTVRFPPLQDLPYHLARQQILADWNAPAAGYAAVFTRDLFPTPYVLVDWVVAALGGAMPVTLAARLLATLYLVAFPWSLFWLVHGIDPRREAVGFLGFLLAPSWYFHMGFLNFVLALPAAAVTLGWWVRSERRSLGARVAGTAAGLLVVYLLHLYAFGILGLTLGVLALAERRRIRAIATLAAASLPSIALGVALLARMPARPEGEGHAWILLYGGPVRKALQALGALPSFGTATEAVAYGGGAVLALALLAIGWRRRPRPNVWLAATLALAALYLLLPDHVGEVFFVANRVTPFLLIAALPLLAPPASPHGARLVATGAAALVLVLSTGLFLRYHEIDAKLVRYADALATIPPEARVQFRADRDAMREGRIAPAAIFGGYHYLTADADRIPDLEHFAGFLRPIAYRARGGETMSTAAVRDEEALAATLGRRFLVDLGGGALVVGGRDHADVVREAGRWGYRDVELPGAVDLLVKTRPVFAAGPGPESADDGRFYVTGETGDPDTLVVYAPGTATAPPPGREWSTAWSAGGVTVYRRTPRGARAGAPAPAAAGDREAAAGPPR